MFEKIFGIFKKGKKDDLSAAIPDDAEEDMFDIGDTGMDDDFDADTISLETGMSDGGFSDTSGSGISDPALMDSFGDGESAPGDEFGSDFEGTSDADEMGDFDGPISPPPDVEPFEEDAYATPAAKKSKKGLLVTIAVVIIGLVAGFFAASPDAIEKFRRATSSEPTVLEQIEALVAENMALDGQLKAYRTVGTVVEILAIKDEIAKRNEIAGNLGVIEAKVANSTAVKSKLGKTSVRFDQVRRDLVIEQGRLANVQKSLKQIEARNKYLVSSTGANTEQIKQDAADSDKLRAGLDGERIERAEAAARMSLDAQENIEKNALEALSSL
jgi:hypothetical protein